MTKIRSNDKCPCGSGKKYKNCCSGKQPRNHDAWIDISPAENTKAKDLAGLSLDAETGRVLLHTSLGETVEVEHIISKSTYQRKNTSKDDKQLVLMRGLSFNNSPGHLPISIHGHLSKFDLVFAIDTNTDKINGENVSVSVLFRLYTKRTQVGEGLFRYDVPKSAFTYSRTTSDGAAKGIDAIYVGDVPIPISVSRAMCFRSLPGDDAEKYAIYKLVTTIVSANSHAPDIQVAVITDHLHAFKLDCPPLDPLYGDFYVPTNVHIIYASDAANETVLNFAIRKCDTEATGLLRQLKERGFVNIGKSIRLEEIPSVQST